MGKLSLLKEFVQLAVREAAGVPPAPVTAPFQLSSPGQPAKKTRRSLRDGDYTIYREFPLVPSPEMMQSLKLTDDDLEDGVLMGEHEIGIDLTDVYHEREERQTREYPGNPGGYLIEGWNATSLNGIALSPEDSKALTSYLGELTEEESDSLIEQYVENEPEPDFDDGGYDPY